MSEPTEEPAEPELPEISAEEPRAPGGESGDAPPARGGVPPVPAGRADLDDHAKAVLRWRVLSGRRHGENHQRRHRSGADAKKKRPWWVELPILIVIAFLATFLIQTFVARVYYVPSASMEPTLHGVEHGGDRILVYKLGYDFGEPGQGDVVVFKGPPTWAPEANNPGPTTWLGKAARALGSVVGIAPANEKDFVKRVIAVGGQTVSCCDAEGRVQVDGVSLTEPYLFMDTEKYPNWDWIAGESSCAVDQNDPAASLPHRCFGAYTVPDGYIWVMGDHRSDSSDSSFYCRGLTEEEMRQKLDATLKQPSCGRPIPVSDVVGRAVAIVMPPSRWGGVGSPDIMAADATKPDSAGG